MVVWSAKYVLTKEHHKPLIRINHFLQRRPLVQGELFRRRICKFCEPAVDHCLAENGYIRFILVREEKGDNFIWMSLHPGIYALQIPHKWAGVEEKARCMAHKHFTQPKEIMCLSSVRSRGRYSEGDCMLPELAGSGSPYPIAPPPRAPDSGSAAPLQRRFSGFSFGVTRIL